MLCFVLVSPYLHQRIRDRVSHLQPNGFLRLRERDYGGVIDNSILYRKRAVLDVSDAATKFKARGMFRGNREPLQAPADNSPT